MTLLQRVLTLLVFSALFLLGVLPVGWVLRAVADPLRLRKTPRRASYLRLAKKTPQPATVPTAAPWSPHTGTAERPL